MRLRTFHFFGALTFITSALLGFSGIVLPADASTPSFALGSARDFGLLGGSAVTLGANSQLLGNSGFIAGLYPGAALDASAATAAGATTLNIADTVARQAQADIDSALNQLSSANASAISADLGGQTLQPGYYHSVAALAMTSDLTLNGNGDSTSIFIIHADGALNTTASTRTVLINGALATNVYWVSGGAVTTGATTQLDGTLIASGAITFGAGTIVRGQALGLAAITLGAGSQIIYNVPAPSLTTTPEPTPTATPSATPTPAPTPSATPTSDPAPAPAPAPSATPTPSSTPTPEPSASPSPEPTVITAQSPVAITPAPEPIRTVAPLPSPRPTPTATATPTPTPTSTANAPVKTPGVATTYFTPGSATISPSTKMVLTAALNRLLKANVRVLNVIGYSDQSPGSKSDPIALYRANAVAGFLLKLSPKLRIRVFTAGQASDKGVAMTTAAQRINRRVEIRQP